MFFNVRKNGKAQYKYFLLQEVMPNLTVILNSIGTTALISSEIHKIFWPVLISPFHLSEENELVTDLFLFTIGRLPKPKIILSSFIFLLSDAKSISFHVAVCRTLVLDR